MAMDPVITKKKIEHDYIEYLSSILEVRDKEINRKVDVALKASKFVKGPYLEATLPFCSGKSLKELADEDIISREFEKINDDIHYERPLYKHQDSAVRKIAGEDKNVIVATGTGSGKTECYMLPIFNCLMREKEMGKLGAGVRALLLFPMNALANDQVKKIRQLLKNYPDITFGRYTGETESRKTEEEVRKEYAAEHGEQPLENEMLTRSRMQQTPPHILLTNYAMLEYLLLRPKDSELFDGENAKSWKYIVIDEAHTYKGSNGTEIAILLRRLKERIHRNSSSKITCIATSATLGNEDAKDALAAFAEGIFDEKFDVKDIVTSDRVKRTATSEMRPLGINDYRRIKKLAEGVDESEKSAFLYDNLVNDSRIVTIQKVLEKKPMNAEEIANRVFEDVGDEKERIEGFVTLVELATCAKKDENSNALLPARYHLFVKSLEGLFISLYPQKNVYLERKASILNEAGRVVVFELANCQNCGQEYLVGRIKDGRLELPVENEPQEYFIIDSAVNSGSLDFDEDDEDAIEGAAGADISELEKYKLCTVCGRIYPADEKHGSCCDKEDDKKLITVYKLKRRRDKSEVNGCIVCGSVKKGIVKKFYTSNHAATFAVANSLYDAIPPKAVEADDDIFMDEVSDLFFGEDIIESSPSIEDERGRKLLIFSDNRQEAAFFAGYLGNKHDFIMWRRLILKELKKESEGIYIKDLIDRLKVAAEKNNLYSTETTLTDREKENIAARYVLFEFMEMDKKTGLVGRGLIEVFPEEIKLGKGKWSLSPEETWNLLRFFMDTLRTSFAVIFPETLSYSDDFFAPRNREVGFRLEKGTPVIKAFVPAEGKNNKRSEFVKKIMERGCEEYKEILQEAFKLIVQLSKYGYIRKKKLQKYSNEGDVYAIDYKKWKMRAIREEQKLYRCKKCGAITAYSIRGKCQVFKCDGELEAIDASVIQKIPYYYSLYTQEKLIPMVAKEHTAQLSREAAGEYQVDFEKGKINVLSCSTTFEMGVDVGELEATFLRNVPPETANYIQRAGRAGRRTSSTAFAVTFARRNSHDINFYNRPEDIISGKIKPPYIEICNDKIVSRHINSIILSWFFSKHPEYFDNVAVLNRGDGTKDVAVILKDMMAEKPQELLDSIIEAIPDELVDTMHIREWEFADRLVGEDGTLTVALRKRNGELKQLKEFRDERYKAGKKVDAIGNLINTLEKERCINFLASSGVLPKYGFPVDVVNLDIINNSKVAERIELSRDLKLAISEFAPPSSVVANGYVWTSHAINTVPDKGWPEEFYYECPKCGRIAPDEGMHIGYDDAELRTVTKQCYCGGTMKIHRFIIPIFGFSTSLEAVPKRVGEDKPRRYYATRTQFWGVDALNSFQEEQRIEKMVSVGKKPVNIVYTPNGKLAVINRGRSGAGLFVCKTCGFVSEESSKVKHKNKYGYECINQYLSNLSIGHTFNSDILKLELPQHYGEYNPEEQWTSTLYAILEGASSCLGIDRNDINGCITYSDGKPAFILYDESEGGAGHVKRIAGEIEEVMEEALLRVSGSCGCSEDTSCYGCLRNYGNQFEHEKIIRGAAKNYLDWLLNVYDYAEDACEIYADKEEVEYLVKFCDEGQNQCSETVKEIWANLLEDCEDDEMETIHNIADKCPDNIIRPIYHESFLIAETGEKVYTDLIWPEQKVILFLKESEADYKIAQKIGWNCYCTVDGINAEEFISRIEVK